MAFFKQWLAFVYKNRIHTSKNGSVNFTDWNIFKNKEEKVNWTLARTSKKRSRISL